jgi:sugar/nucleoside kinase (ribokinase family)
MPSLLCVGEAFDDLIFLDLDRLPRAGEEIRTSRFASTVGGGAVITAVAASRLGLRSRVIGGLGPQAVARLRAERVGVVNLIRPGELQAVSASLSTRDDRSFVTFNGVNDHLDGRLFAMRRRIRAPFVHFAFPPRDCARWATFASRLHAEGVVASWDFGWNDGLTRDRGFKRLLASLDYVFVNAREATCYTRTRTLAAAVDAWRGLARNTVIKLGGRGSVWIAGPRVLFVTVRRRRPVDTTGAGDAFNGGFLSALARGLPPRECLRVANFVGSASTRRAGGLDGLPSRARK